MKVALQWELPGRWCQIKLLYRCFTFKTGSEMRRLFHWRREGRRCKSKVQNCSGFLLTFNMHLLVSSRTFCIPSPQFLPSSLLFAASQVPFGFLIIRAVLCACLLDHYMPSFWLWPGLVWSTKFQNSNWDLNPWLIDMCLLAKCTESFRIGMHRTNAYINACFSELG